MSSFVEIFGEIRQLLRLRFLLLMVVDVLGEGIIDLNGLHVRGQQLKLILRYHLMRLAYETYVDTMLSFLKCVLSWLMESIFYGSGSDPLLDRCRSCV